MTPSEAAILTQRPKSFQDPWQSGLSHFTVQRLTHRFVEIFFPRLLRSAKWRKGPASAGQIALVAKRHGKMSAGPDGSQNLEQLTKGQAANIITRLKHGAKVGMYCIDRDHTLKYIILIQKRHEDKLKDVKKVTDKALKESLRRARETVQVGPLQQ